MEVATGSGVYEGKFSCYHIPETDSSFVPFVDLHHRNTAAVIMKIAFGYNVTDNDHFISVAEEAAKISGWALAPGRWLVDYYPIRRSSAVFLASSSTFMVYSWFFVVLPSSNFSMGVRFMRCSLISEDIRSWT